MNPEPGFAYARLRARTSLPVGVGTSERDGSATPPCGPLGHAVDAGQVGHAATQAWSLFLESAPIE